MLLLLVDTTVERKPEENVPVEPSWGWQCAAALSCLAGAASPVTGVIMMTMSSLPGSQTRLLHTLGVALLWATTPLLLVGGWCLSQAGQRRADLPSPPKGHVTRPLYTWEPTLPGKGD